MSGLVVAKVADFANIVLVFYFSIIINCFPPKCQSRPTKQLLNIPDPRQLTDSKKSSTLHLKGFVLWLTNNTIISLQYKTKLDNFITFSLV